MASATGKFSLQWVNNATFQRPMCSARFNLRDSLSPFGEAGLTCGRLHLDQVHIQFRPNGTEAQPNIQDSEYTRGDSRDREWIAETLQLCVRITPGERYVLYTSGKGALEAQSPDAYPQRSLVYSTSMGAGYNTGFEYGGDASCRSYRPIRDLPVLHNAAGLTEIQVDLLWPLLQGDPEAVWWSVPDYRIYRVVCDFSYTSS